MLGVSGISPDLVNRWIDELPALKSMRTKGAWARLEGFIPPQGPHAWISSISGRNPGAFGVWGDRYRSSFTYSLDGALDSTVVDERVRPLHRILPKLGQRVAALNLPALLPLPHIPAGYCVAGKLSGAAGRFSAFPEDFARELEERFGKEGFSVPRLGDERSELDRQAIAEAMQRTDDHYFALIRSLIEEKHCDIVMAVLEGVEIASHLFLRDFDENHASHDPRSSYSGSLLEYYRFIDERVGELAAMLDDDTVLLLYSVSSVRRLDGIFNLNEWFLERGYLSVKNYPSEASSLDNVQVDWAGTKAWAMGETGQIFLNLQGREAEGSVAPGARTELLEQLEKDLREEVASMGKGLSVEFFHGDSVFNGGWETYGPDLLLHIDGGRWRTDQRVGHGKKCIMDSGTLQREIWEGADRFGYLGVAGSTFPASGDLGTASVLDIAPSIMDIMNLRLPYGKVEYDMEGYSLLLRIRDATLGAGEQAEDDEEKTEEDKVRSRLEALGY
jgi:predicted AlkP superfamily phosphohydrolase/phosphomutase